MNNDPITDIDSERFFKSFVEGDESAFARLISEESSRLYANIYRFVKTKFDAEEIMQDIFVESWCKREAFSSLKDIYGYLYSRARYKSLDFLKKQSSQNSNRQDPVENAVKELIPDVESQYEINELILLIDLAIEQLSPQRKAVFKMSIYEGLKRGEIAEKMNLAPQTVTNYLNDAVEQIRKTILVFALLYLSFFG